jgi:hypothetical protein
LKRFGNFFACRLLGSPDVSKNHQNLPKGSKQETGIIIIIRSGKEDRNPAVRPPAKE